VHTLNVCKQQKGLYTFMHLANLCVGVVWELDVHMTDALLSIGEYYIGANRPRVIATLQAFADGCIEVIFSRGKSSYER
jgi:hypothetical protein